MQPVLKLRVATPKAGQDIPFWAPALPSEGLCENNGMACKLQSRELARVNADGTERMLRALDLVAIARSLRGPLRAA